MDEEARAAFREGAEAALALVAENARLRECLEGMIWQFGHHFERDGNPYLGTMGLSNLEDAFEVLGWVEPHPVPGEEQ